MASATASAPQADKEGRLEIRMSAAWWFLWESQRIEIRDGSQKLVKSLQDHQPSVPLAPGLYSVSAMLEDGTVHRRHVHIQPGETELVEFAVEELALRDGSREGTAEGVEMELFDGAREVSREGGRWVLAPPEDLVLESVPFARITTSAERFEVSLPVNPTAAAPNTCEVETRMGRRGLRIIVRPAPERQVTSALERMAESGHMEHSTAFAKQAMRLLLDKYEDPVGAAFGGLLLHRLGILEARPRWLENLARDFSWLPDGQVLLAALLARKDDPEERRRGLDLLLDAAPRRMMFSDGLSLALELLRRWPDESSLEQRQRILGELSPVAARAQWGASVLTVKW